jgi:putative ABC transport system ATP-binding protein
MTQLNGPAPAAGASSARFTPATGEPTVRIHGLNHAFGQGEVRQQVLFNLKFEISPGELVILTGASGCGKTTLLTLIGALRSVQDGSVGVLGQELRGLGKPDLVAVRRQIGFIFQSHNLLDPLTAGENVNMAINLNNYTPDQLYEHAAGLLGTLDDSDGPVKILQGVPRSRGALARALVVGLLEKLELHHRVDYKPKGLSGGQKQRVAIARALANHPRLILADEPTAALDTHSGELVVSILKRLARAGSTILVVTHDPRVIDQGDRVVNMEAGEIASDIRVDKTVRIISFLHRVSVFSGLTPAKLVEVAENMMEEAYPPNICLIRQGDKGDKFYLIKKGQVDVSRVDDTGVTHHEATLGAGDFFGELALMEDKPRNATVITKDHVEVYTLSKEGFRHARDTSESMRDELIKVFAQRYRRSRD